MSIVGVCHRCSATINDTAQHYREVIGWERQPRSTQGVKWRTPTGRYLCAGCSWSSTPDQHQHELPL